MPPAKDARIRVREQVFPELLLRYGVSEQWELWFVWEGYLFSDEKDRRTRTSRRDAGSTDIALGFKRALTEQARWLPETVVIGALSAPRL